MKTFFVATLFLFISSVAFAQTETVVDLTLLPDSARLAILDQQKKAAAAAAKVPISENFSEEAIEKYATIGKMLAISMKEFCATIGVEVNTFIKTPAGKIVTALLIWKYIGSELTSFFMGTFILFSCFMIVFMVAKRFLMKRKTTTVKLDENNKKVKCVEYEEPHFKQGSESWWGMLIVSTILLTIIVVIYMGAIL